jgi:hypothetical protein
MAGHFQGNGLFGLEVQNLTPGVSHVSGRVHLLDATVHAPGDPPLAQQIQIAANGLGGDLESLGQILHPDKVRLADHIGNVRLSLGEWHGLQQFFNQGRLMFK